MEIAAETSAPVLSTRRMAIKTIIEGTVAEMRRRRNAGERNLPSLTDTRELAGALVRAERAQTRGWGAEAVRTRLDIVGMGWWLGRWRV